MDSDYGLDWQLLQDYQRRCQHSCYDRPGRDDCCTHCAQFTIPTFDRGDQFNYDLGLAVKQQLPIPESILPICIQVCSSLIPLHAANFN